MARRICRPACPVSASTCACISAHTSAIGKGTRTINSCPPTTSNLCWTCALSSGICFSRRLSPLKRDSQPELSGPNVSVPFDMSVDQNNGGGQGPAFLNGAVPAVADTYQFLVTFSDGSTLTIPSSVTAVLNSFVTGMAMNSPVAGTATVPVLNWVTPTSTPSPYTY